MEGWAGKYLDIDLSSGKIKSHPLDMEMARLFLGGRGLGARLLWDLVGPEVEPLSEANVLIFCTGPLTASGLQTTNRFTVTTKSPLTGTVCDSNSGSCNFTETIAVSPSRTSSPVRFASFSFSTLALRA